MDLLEPLVHFGKEEGPWTSPEEPLFKETIPQIPRLRVLFSKIPLSWDTQLLVPIPLTNLTLNKVNYLTLKCTTTDTP